MIDPKQKSRLAVCFVTLLACAILYPSLGASAPVPAADTADVAVITKVAVDTSSVTDSTSGGDTFVAYYFHGTQRCVTCRKLEAYSEEALTAQFEQEIIDSVLSWCTVDYDEEQNEHFIKDYKLFTKAVILSRIRAGVEVEWKNLDKIWHLVGDKEEFISYIQTETQAFMEGDGTDE